MVLDNLNRHGTKRLIPSLPKFKNLSKAMPIATFTWKKEGESYVILAYYVDDATLFGNNVDLLKHAQLSYPKRFEMKDFGEVHSCLGLQVICNKNI